MKIKILLAIICCFLYINTTIAQRGNTYYLKNSGVEVPTKDSADFIRIVTEPDAKSTLYNINEFYKNGKTKLIGKTIKLDPIVLDGECTTYFPSGKKQQHANYEKGHLVGDVYNYYPNGRVYLYRQYITDTVRVPGKLNYLILACNDSTGKELITDGNGHYIGYDSDFKNIYEEGDVKSGLKTGNWIGNNGMDNDKVTFTEKYENGNFISGESTDKSNNLFKYNIPETAPQFKGGIQAFYNFLSKQNLSQSGNNSSLHITIYVSGVIEKDGTLDNLQLYRLTKNPEYSKIIEALQRSPKWEPGTKYGQVVKTQYIFPINYGIDGPVKMIIRNVF